MDEPVEAILIVVLGIFLGILGMYLYESTQANVSCERHGDWEICITKYERTTSYTRKAK